MPKDRFLVKLLKNNAEKNEADYKYLSQGWVILVSKDGETKRIYGNRFDLNSASACRIASNKASLSLILEDSNIPCVEHHLFIRPDMVDFVDNDGNWSDAIKFANNNNYNLICKANQGTGGRQVFRVCSQRELEVCFQNLHQSEKGLTLSPFMKIKNEYRLVLLDTNCLLCYSKVLPYVIGNGVSSYESLIYKYLQKKGISKNTYNEALSQPTIGLQEIPENERRICIYWKHNISKMATPEIVENKHLVSKLHQFAEKARKCSGLRFASVDVIESSQELLIMEINSGVSLSHFARSSQKAYKLTEDIYLNAINRMFD